MDSRSLPLYRRVLSLTLAPLLALLTVACGDDGTGPGDELLPLGTAKVTLSGDVSRSFQGQAFFGSDSDPESGLHFHGIGITSGDGSNDFIWLSGASQSPDFPEGSHSLLNLDLEYPDEVDEDVPLQGFGLLHVFQEDGLQSFTASVSGSLTTNRTGAGGMEGSVQAQTAGFSFDPETGEPQDLSVSVQADFHAAAGPVDFPSGAPEA